MARLRLILMVLLAGAVSLAAGLAVNWLTDLTPCQGEGLACNIDAAIGGYGVIILAGAGTIIFIVTLLVARSRKALAIALAVLLVPLLLIFLVTQVEHSSTIGFEPYRQFRTVLVMILPPTLAVVIQFLILRLVIPAAPAVPTP